MSGSAENATLLAKGATADVYAWGEGRVLKLFTERTPWHANEVSATRAAQEAGLPVPALIDWAIGTRCNPLADYARTWLISRMWLDSLEMGAPEQVRLLWRRFWRTYLQRYGELRSSSPEALLPWQIVVATASLAWDRSVASTGQRVSFVQAALCGAEHPWLSD